MTAKIAFKIDCPGCGKHLTTTATLLTKEARSDYSGNTEVVATVELDHRSWFEAHGDSPCELAMLPPAEALKRNPLPPAPETHAAPVRIIETTREELTQQKADLLERIRLTRDELADRADKCQLTGDEWAAWDELRNIEFLLDGEKH